MDIPHARCLVVQAQATASQVSGAVGATIEHQTRPTLKLDRVADLAQNA
jgi:hypothetical protein